MGVLWDPEVDSLRPFALSAASEVGDGDRDGSSMAEAAASVLAVGTLAHPAIAIAEPSASTHHRNPLIALSSPTRVHEFQRFPDSPSDGRSFPRDSPSKKEIARAYLILEVSPAGVDEDHESCRTRVPGVRSAGR